MSLKVKASEKMLTNITDFEDAKKKSSNIIEEYNNLFGPFDEIENKYTFNVKVPRYRSFLKLFDELGLDNNCFYIDKSENLVEDHLDNSKDEKKYNEMVTKFKGKERK